jgi:O-antigen/teichoic acid export membrane protein
MRGFPRRFRRNVVTSYLSTTISAVQVLLVTPLLVRGLGAELYGIWSLVASVALFTILLDFGLASATTRYVAHYEELRDRASAIRAVAISFWILAGLGVVGLILGVVLAPIFPVIFSVPGEQVATAVLVVLVAAAGATTIAGGAFQGALAGLMRYSSINLIRIGATLGQATAYALCIVLGGKLVALGLALLAATAAEVIARYIALRHFLPGVSISPRLVERRFAREMVGMSAWISSTQIATAIRYRIDTLVVGLVAGVTAAGVYAVGQLLFVAAERFIRPITTGFFPFSAELAGRGDRTGLRDAVVTGTRISLAVAGPLCLAIILVAGPMIDVWVGPEFDDARLVVVYLAAALLLAQLSRAGLVMLQGSGNVRAPAAIIWAEAAVNFFFSVTLGLVLGLTGVALATLVATVVVSTAAGVPYICRAFGLSTSAFVLPLLRAHLPAIGLAILTGWALSPGDTAGLLEVVATGAVIAVVYLATLTVTGLSGAERRRIWGMLRRNDSEAASQT